MLCKGRKLNGVVLSPAPPRGGLLSICSLFSKDWQIFSPITDSKLVFSVGNESPNSHHMKIIKSHQVYKVLTSQRPLRGFTIIYNHDFTIGRYGERKWLKKQWRRAKVSWGERSDFLRKLRAFAEKDVDEAGKDADDRVCVACCCEATLHHCRLWYNVYVGAVCLPHSVYRHLHNWITHWDHSSCFEGVTNPSVVPVIGFVIWACPKIYCVLLVTFTVIVVNATRCNINDSCDVNVFPRPE